jgi:hypothetical protein
MHDAYCTFKVPVLYRQVQRKESIALIYQNADLAGCSWYCRLRLCNVRLLAKRMNCRMRGVEASFVTLIFRLAASLETESVDVLPPLLDRLSVEGKSNGGPVG